MKKLNKFISILCISCASFSCSDMMETETPILNIEPEISQKSDSAFYAFGILTAMQQVADQYVFQGELRGDLLKVVPGITDKNLQSLADFSATTENKYDSAYAYYRIINNCNYYIAKADTSLYTGATNVVIRQYAATLAIRAWAYMQLARNYGKVPFYTTPLTAISQIESNSFPELDIYGIVEQLAPELEKFTGFEVPTLHDSYRSTSGAGTQRWGSQSAKTYRPSACFIPVDVILGEMYLETEKYDQAARHYITYLTKVAPDVNQRSSYYIAPLREKGSFGFGRFASAGSTLPDPSVIAANYITGTRWSEIFGLNSFYDIITYIPMAVNSQSGTTTNVPYAFGFDYYSDSRSEPYLEKIQLLPSSAMNTLSDSTEYYYYYRTSKTSTLTQFDSVAIANCGDMRMRSVTNYQIRTDSTTESIDKYKYGNIVLYRTSTILLHLAEAFNRLNMPDAAFAILKDGISPALKSTNSAGSYVCAYMDSTTIVTLDRDYQLFNEKFTEDYALGIHCHGTGFAASDLTPTSVYKPGSSLYTLDRMVGKKLSQLTGTFGTYIGTTRQDTINAVEDILCDEYALELAFEGSRYYDLMRLARHKNVSSPGTYPSNFGSLWLDEKIRSARQSDGMSLSKSLVTESNWYLPFK